MDELYRNSILDSLRQMKHLYGNHVVHNNDGQSYNDCLACRLADIEADVSNQVIKMPKYTGR